MKKKALLYGLFVLLIMGLFACQKHEKHHEEMPELPVTSPLRKDTSITREYVCQIHAIQHIEVRALEEGYLQNIYVDEGQRVKKGQLLFQIMPVVYQAELQKAQAEVHYAQVEYDNAKALADSNIISPAQLALVRAKLEKAKAELALAQSHLAFTKITAPFDGLVGRFHVRLGSLLEEGELLTTLSDVSQLWVYFNVPEAEYLEYMRYRATDPTSKTVRLRMANGQVFDQEGKITAIESEFDNKTGTVAFRATFPNPDALLRHGETGNILMTLPLNNVWLIPQKATFEVLDKKYVYVVDKEGKIQARRIKIAAEFPHIYAVEKGLSENDRIVFEGLNKLRNGDRIKYHYVEPQQVLQQLDLYAE